MSARRRGRWSRAILWGFALWAASRILIGTVALLTQYSLAGHGTIGSKAGWPFRLLFHWDSNYLRGIALHGYFSERSADTWVAFFPGYPLVSRGVAQLVDPTGPSSQAVTFAMWLVVTIASLIATILLFRVAEQRLSARGAVGATALFILGPYALFLAASYSEALFLAFAVGAWLCGSRDRWLAAGLLAAAASATRPNGIFLACAIVVMYLVRRREAGKPILSWNLVAAALGFTGTVAYFVYLSLNTGSLLSWSQSQAAWHRSLQWPWETLYQTAGRVIYASSLDRQIQFGLDIVFAVILVAGIVYFVRTKRWPEVTYLGLTAISLMTSYSYLSLARNTVTLFPLVLALAGATDKPSRRVLFWIAFSLGLLLLVFNTRQFALGYWAD